jgi:hypothetical protein
MDIVYIYVGDPQKYDKDNDYDAIFKYENGEYKCFIKPESLNDDDKIYIFESSVTLTENELLQVIGKTGICYKKHFTKEKENKEEK